MFGLFTEEIELKQEMGQGDLESVIDATLIYHCNGDDERFRRVFELLPESKHLEEDIYPTLEHPVLMSIYPLSKKESDEMLSVQQQLLRQGETKIVSPIVNQESFDFFALFLPSSKEMIGAVRMKAPVLDVESQMLLFPDDESFFVFLFPGTSMFPKLDYLHSFIVDARLSVLLE